MNFIEMAIADILMNTNYNPIIGTVERRVSKFLWRQESSDPFVNKMKILTNEPFLLKKWLKCYYEMSMCLEEIF